MDWHNQKAVAFNALRTEEAAQEPDPNALSIMAGSYAHHASAVRLEAERVRLECDHHPGTMDGPWPRTLPPDLQDRLVELNAELDRLGVLSADL